MLIRSPLSVAALLLAGLTGPAGAALFERETRDVHAEVQAAAGSGRNLAVLLTMPDCPGCRDMEQNVFRDAATEKAFEAKFAAVRVDITQGSTLMDPVGNATTASRWATRLHAVGTPSFVFLNPQGQVLYRYTGALDARGFRQLSQYVASGQYENHPFRPPQPRQKPDNHH